VAGHLISSASVDLDDLGASLTLDVAAPVVLALAAVVHVDVACSVSATTTH